MRFGLLVALPTPACCQSTPAFADPLPDGFGLDKFNASQAPTTANGITTFHVIPGDCSDVDYGDGRGGERLQEWQWRSRSSATSGTPSSVNRSSTNSTSRSIRASNMPASSSLTPCRSGQAAGTARCGSLASWEGEFIKNFVSYACKR